MVSGYSGKWRHLKPPSDFGYTPLPPLKQQAAID